MGNDEDTRSVSPLNGAVSCRSHLAKVGDILEIHDMDVLSYLIVS